MLVRWVASVTVLMVIAIVGIFFVAVLRQPTSNEQSGRVDRQASRIQHVTSRTGPWTVSAEISPSVAGNVTIVVSAAAGDGRPPTAPPKAALRMLDMAMGVQPLALEYVMPGRWRGSSIIPMEGRWSLDVEIDGGRASLPFEAMSR